MDKVTLSVTLGTTTVQQTYNFNTDWRPVTKEDWEKVALDLAQAVKWRIEETKPMPSN